jgi:hypothetical protein
MAAFEPGVMAAITGTESSLYSKATFHTTLPSQAAHTIRAPQLDTAFLILAPVMSSDYPTPASSRASSLASTKPSAPVLAGELSGSAIDMTESAEASEQIKKDRRSSSTSSYGAFRRRFLKLGPVHNGGDPGVSDYVDIEEEA